MNRQNQTTQQGFTLIEFMISSVLGLIVIAAVGSLYLYTSKLNDIAMQRVSVQQDLRTASTIISRDARLAGNYGCLNIGMIYGEESFPSMKTDFKMRYSDRAKTNLGAYATDRPGGTSDIATANPSFGVRVMDNFNINGFALQGKALLFYYGLGSSALTSKVDVSGTKNNLNGQNLIFQDSDPNQTILNTANKANGLLAISSCSAVYVFRGGGADTDSTNKQITARLFGNEGGKDVELLAKDEKAPNTFQPHTISLFRYMITAYAVGTVDGKTGLYRFELGEDGEWQGPELLADNVSQMDIGFIYATAGNSSATYTGCPTAFGDGTTTSSTFNNYDMVKSSDTFLKGKEGIFLSPSALELKLTYTYPKVGNEDTGVTGNQEYFIYSAIRGGNACASRILSN